MKCPVCTTTDLLMTDRQGVEIDYCPQCRGIWLDRGELDKVIERSVQPAQHSPGQQTTVSGRPHPQQHFGHGHDDHWQGKHHKKKSLLEDLFDF